MITVDRTAPLLTVQDVGRFGLRAEGVTTSGALDPRALDVANALAGNARTAAALEGCLGGASFTFGRRARFAVTGAEVSATLDGVPVDTYVTLQAREGGVLIVDRLVRGAIWYLAIEGGLDTPMVLGSRSTLVSGGLGGVGGAPIRAGTTIAFADDVRRDGAESRAPARAPDSLRTPLTDEPIPVASGPRHDALSADEWTALYSMAFTVSRASSRVGYRLEGPVVPSHLPADLASEPACAGAIQLPPEGQPIVLMADHPTVGGYPIIGVVPAYAVGMLAQRTPGSNVRFRPETRDDALARLRAQREIFQRWLESP